MHREILPSLSIFGTDRRIDLASLYRETHSLGNWSVGSEVVGNLLTQPSCQVKFVIRGVHRYSKKPCGAFVSVDGKVVLGYVALR